MPPYDYQEGLLGLPAGILAAVIAQESGGNSFAFRFEPDFYARYILNKTKAELGGTWSGLVSEATERYGRAHSWGLMQVMGQVARELGFTDPFLTSLCDPEKGVKFGALLLSKKLAKYGNLEDALSAYNAGSPSEGNRSSYVAPILARMQT